MVSNGPSSQSYNFTHKYNNIIPPCSLVKKTIDNSIAGIISSDFKIFNYILKISKLQTFLKDLQSDFTIFVPSDESINFVPDIVFENMDIAVARHIIMSSIVDKKLSLKILQSSPFMYLSTKDPLNKLCITNIHGKTFINNINILQPDIIAENGIIHVTDNIFWPYII